MTQTATMDDFMTGKPQTLKMTTTIVSPDHHVFEMWGPDPSGKNVKQMEITTGAEVDRSCRPGRHVDADVDVTGRRALSARYEPRHV